MKFNPDDLDTFTPEQQRGLTILLNDKFINFLAAAYGVPPATRALVIERTDSVEDRNYSLLIMCFCAFLLMKEHRFVMPSPAIYEELAARLDEFLADAVKQTFWNK